MSQPYMGEIRMFAGNFPPNGWALCQGQLLPISQNDALFVVLGTIYGGDGQETFGLPNLKGRIPIHMGQGPGITQNYVIGEAAGVESVTLTTQQIPSHNHTALCNNSGGNNPSPANNVWANFTDKTFYSTQPATTAMAGTALSPIGGSQPHENMMPYLAINFILSLYGIFPSPT